MIMKYLSRGEQRALLIAQRRRTVYRRRMKLVEALGKAAHLPLVIAVCLGAVLAIPTAANAVESPQDVSAPALFDQANADQRAGRLGPAILGYERARLLAPRDEAILQNLRAARDKAGVAAPAIPKWQRPAHWLSFDALAGLASISLLLFSLLFFGTRLIPTTLRSAARITGASLGGIVLLAATAIVLRWPELDRAVIVGHQVVAHIAPATDAGVAFEPKPGELVRAETTYGHFVRIRAADGRSGWVNGADVETIIPAAS